MAYTTIDDPSQYFQVATWSGNASNQAITNDGNSDLQPDWLWIKARNEASDHALLDSTRGLTKRIHSNTTDQETNDSSATVSSFDSDGFTMTQYNVANDSDDTGVAWQWKANGGTTSSNSDGSITSTVQANTTAGFSIVTYTGAGGNQTIGHGLGVVPKWILIKRRDDAGDWTGYHSVLGDEKFMRLNSGNAVGDQATYFNDTTPTSTVFTVGNAGDVNYSTGTHVAYCFAEIQGYSKFGSYKGNGSSTVTNGPFIYTGFKPAWTMIKRSDSTSDGWYIHDSTRSPNNVIDKAFRANADNAESGENIDFLSNGFAIRIGANNNFNNASGTYIYMAFAEHPFVSSEGVPVTAR